MFLLDTNTVVDYFRGRGKVAERLLALPPGEIGLPAVVAYEVWVGVLASENAHRRQSQLERFLSVVAVVPFDAMIARRAAQVRHALERRGQGIGPIDTLIAATALAHNATLVTRNVKEFSRVDGLAVSNWYD